MDHCTTDCLAEAVKKQALSDDTDLVCLESTKSEFYVLCKVLILRPLSFIDTLSKSIFM